MPFVKRDESGRIIALFREKETGAEEYLPPHHDDVRSFVGTATAGETRDTEAEFFRSDQTMIRVFEDLLDTLIDKKAVLLTDLPEPAQMKLLNRKRLRTELTRIGEILSDESDDIF